MSSHTSISLDKLSRLIGTAKTPIVIDVRTEEDFAADPRLIPGAVRRSHQDAADWRGEFAGHPAIVVCIRGEKLAQGTAACLRNADDAWPISSDTVGGFAGQPDSKERPKAEAPEQLHARTRQYAYLIGCGGSNTATTHIGQTNKKKG